MKKVRKKLIVLSMMLVMITMLTACNKSMSYYFTVETGDKVAVKCDISDGYALKQESGIFMVYDETEALISQGFFVTKEMYDAYMDSVTTSGATIIADTQKDGVTYLQYQLETDTHTEDNFICWIDGSNTGVVVASIAGQEEAESAFSLLSFEVQED